MAVAGSANGASGLSTMTVLGASNWQMTEAYGDHDFSFSNVNMTYTSTFTTTLTEILTPTTTTATMVFDVGSRPLEDNGFEAISVSPRQPAMTTTDLGSNVNVLSLPTATAETEYSTRFAYTSWTDRYVIDVTGTSGGGAGEVQGSSGLATPTYISTGP